MDSLLPDSDDLNLTTTRFDIQDEEDWLKYLDMYGYVVIKQVASPDEVSKGLEYIWDFFETFPDSNVKRNDPKTWNPTSGWFARENNGICQGYGFSHSKFLWHTRLLPCVERAFKCVWGKERSLIVSYDGGNAFRPYKYKSDWLTEGGWWHVDQNGYNTKERVCVQGLLSYTDAGPSTGGMCVIAKSHLKFDEITNRYANKDFKMGLEPDFVDFVAINPNDPLLNDQENRVLVCCKAGDLVLWDSRTIHCNTPALPSYRTLEVQNGNTNQIVDLIRVCGYVSMTPRDFASEQVLEARRQAFVHNEGTSHWPHKFVSAGGRTASYWLPKQSTYNLSKKQRELIGLSPTLTSREMLSMVMSPFGFMT